MELILQKCTIDFLNNIICNHCLLESDIIMFFKKVYYPCPINQSSIVQLCRKYGQVNLGW